MKILIVTNYPGSFPYVDELGYWLHQNGISSDILDIENLKLHRSEAGVFDAGTDLFPSAALNKLLHLPKFGPRLRIAPVWRWLAQHANRYDVVNIHYAAPTYCPYMRSLAKVGRRVVTVIWGSDFYRISSRIRSRQRRIYDRSDRIVFGNPATATAFTDYYRTYFDKVRIVGFGIQKLEKLKALKGVLSKDDAKREAGFPTDKVVITCGYNGSAMQQHEWMLDTLAGLPAATRERLFVVVPMTYGGTPAQISATEQQLQRLGLPGRVLKGFMDEDAVARLRLATDIALNAQITDSLSASLQEHLFAGNVLVAGDWLPYKVFEDLGIQFYTYPKESLAAVLQPLIDHYDAAAAAVAQNGAKIYALSSWGSRIGQWLEVLDEAPASVH